MAGSDTFSKKSITQYRQTFITQPKPKTYDILLK